MPTLVTLVDGTIPVAADFNGNYQALNNAIGSSTVISGWSIGELPYASGTNTLARLTPGSVGQVLTMGATIPGWQGGAWVTPAYSAGDFTANASQTWTVDSGDVLTYAYTLVGKTMTVNFHIATSTVGGTPAAELRIKIPTGATSATGKTFTNFIRTSDNGAAFVASICQVVTATTYISCYNTIATANWTNSSNNTAVQGQITFEIA